MIPARIPLGATLVALTVLLAWVPLLELRAQSCTTTLTNAKFVPILRGDASTDARTITTYVTAGDPASYPHLSKVFKHPVPQSVLLERTGPYGCFYAPIFISMNPKLVTVSGSGTSQPSSATVTAYTTAVPTAETQVELRAIWGTVTKKVYWKLKPAPPAPYSYAKSISLPQGNPTVGSIANFELRLIRPADPGGTRVYWRMAPAEAFKAVSGDVSYSATGVLNQMVIPQGEDIKRFKLEVLSRPATGTAYVQTWVGNQNVSARPEYLEQAFTVIVPVP
jgi:hypothetical protein